MRSPPFEKSNNRHFSDVDPRLATSIFTASFFRFNVVTLQRFNGSSLEPFPETRQSVVRAGDYLHAYNLSDLRCRSGTRISRCLDCRHVATEKAGYISAADFFPANQDYVRCL